VEPGPGALEQRAGTGPDTSALDDQIEMVRAEQASAVSAQEHERADRRPSRAWWSTTKH
jgi:hypothetical protein